MKIAICALGWNKAEFTKNWLESVKKNSEGHDVQLFLMDNGSTDDGETTRVMIDASPLLFRRNENNESIYKGWNYLVKTSLCIGQNGGGKDGKDFIPDVICISNNDMLVGPGWLDPVSAEFAHGDNEKYYLPNGNERDYDYAVKWNQPYLVGGRQYGRAGWCMFFHRDAIKHFYPIPEELELWYGDDWIHHRLHKAGYACEVLMDSCCKHFTSTSFYARPGYGDIVNQDKIKFDALMKMEQK